MFTHFFFKRAALHAVAIFILSWPLLAVMLCLNGCNVYQPDDEGDGGRGGTMNNATGDVIHMPLASGTISLCTQGNGENFSHDNPSTRDGVDFDTPNNLVEQVFAPVAGRAFVHVDIGGFGTHVNIDLGNDTFALIGHLSGTLIENGQMVEQGQLVGTEGCTGYCSGDHVHESLMSGDASWNAVYATSLPSAFITRDVSAGDTEGIYQGSSLVCGLTGGHDYESLLPVTRWLPDGTLVKSPSHPDVFVKDGDTLYLVENEDVFRSYNFDFNEVVLVSDAFLACQNFGQALAQEVCYSATEDNNGNTFIAFECANNPGRYRIAVPDVDVNAVLESWGINTVFPAGSNESNNVLANYPVATGFARLRDGTVVREAGRAEPYVVSEGIALPISSYEVYRLMGFDDRAIIDVASGALNHLVLDKGSCANGVGCVDHDAVTACESGDIGVGGSGVADLDGDGWDETLDCDDTDPAFFPGAPELCNSRDDDCDGQVDEVPQCDEPDPTPEPTPDPTDEPIPDPTLEPTPEPDPDPTPEPTPETTPEQPSNWLLLEIDAELQGPPANYMWLAGELLRANGTPEFWWTTLEYAQNANSVHYQAYVDHGWTLRYSVEDRRNSVVSWSCVAPFPPGVLTMDLEARVNGSPVMIETINNHLGGCELFVRVP